VAERRLVIVESPAKAKTIAGYLGDGYVVESSIGHIRDLPNRAADIPADVKKESWSRLGVNVDDQFQPLYIVDPDKKKKVDALKRELKNSTELLLATDEDREGEAIAWHLLEVLKPKVPVKRMVFHEITREAIDRALGETRDIDDRLVDAQETRRILDRLYGYEVSPVLWKKVMPGLSAGRVQSVATRLVVERERERMQFISASYWDILGIFAPASFEARLVAVDGRRVAQGRDFGDDGRLKSDILALGEDAARSLADGLTGAAFAVRSVDEKPYKRSPAAPFMTSTLQQEAGRKLRFSSAQTMSAAQRLYENGFITYMRTDSTTLSDTAINAARAQISEKFGAAYLPDAPRVYRSKVKNAQEAHEAIRPTSFVRDPEALAGILGRDEARLYRLVWQRALASQMKEKELETTTVDLAAGAYLLRASATRTLFDGFAAVYSEGRDDAEDDAEGTLPPLVVGEVTTVAAVTPTQHFTEPPPRFSEASLVKELEKLGIGRPSTYAQISSTLLARHYVSMLEKRFHPTQLGETVNKLLVPRFPDIFNVEFTSGMELELDRIEDGELTRTQVLGDFWTPFAKRLAAVKPEEMIGEAHDLSTIAEERCPECGSPVIVKTGRFGPYIACTKANNPECAYTLSLRKRGRAPDQPTDVVCEKCGKPMVIKHGRFGEFMACTGYPACRNTKPVPLGVQCPKCGVGDLAEKRAKRGGRKFYGCNRYPECDFTAWNRPVPEVCASCGNVGLEVKETKTKGTIRKCLKCGTEFADAEAAAPALI